MIIKCITLHQPWAWAIFHGKPVENRDWFCGYRGPLLIHAGKTFDDYGVKWIWDNRAELGIPWSAMPSVSDFPRGALIGKVDMIGCVRNHPSPWFFGPWGHVYANPEEFEKPIPAKGKQMLWDWEWKK